MGKTRKKGVRKVGGEGKRKKEGTESSPLPVSSRYIFVFALSQFSGPDCLGAWNRLVAGGIVMPGVLSRWLSRPSRRTPSAVASHADVLRGSSRVPAPRSWDSVQFMFSRGKLCKLSRTFKMYNRQFIQFARIPVEFVACL